MHAHEAANVELLFQSLCYYLAHFLLPTFATKRLKEAKHLAEGQLDFLRKLYLAKQVFHIVLREL